MNCYTQAHRCHDFGVNEQTFYVWSPVSLVTERKIIKYFNNGPMAALFEIYEFLNQIILRITCRLISDIKYVVYSYCVLQDVTYSRTML